MTDRAHFKFISMENHPYNGYGSNLREGSTRRSQSFNQQSGSIEIGADGISSNMDNMTTSSAYMKGVLYDQTTQNCDPYLYGNSSRGPNGSAQRKDRFIRSRDRMPNNHKSYPNAIVTNMGAHTNKRSDPA